MIRNWQKFETVRYSDQPLLKVLPQLKKPILVAGCQRSGTTAITRILRAGGDFGELNTTKDDELDAALILSGEIPIPEGDRLVLQTTYLNNHYREYFEHSNFQLVWILRNPAEVINSMLHNWSAGALRRLFHACGSRALNEEQLARYQRFGHWPFSRLEMACYSYLEKARQAIELSKTLGKDQLRFLDYDQFVSQPEKTVKALCCFFNVSYSQEVIQTLSKRTQRRASSKLSEKKKNQISEMCDAAWKESLKLVVDTPNRNGACNTIRKVDAQG